MPFRALIDACWKEKYTTARFTRDLIAGITVGIIAIPLAMALAIGSGVPPQYGLYTSAVAGIVIALTGGSRFSVSGPTAAFVVILYPVSQQFGLAGLLVATLMSGIFLILFGLARFGRLIEYIPLSVTLGFTSGIGITIGTMQIKDFLGLQMPHVPEHYLQKVAALAMALPTINVGDAAIGVVTLGILILWPRLGIRLPGHLPALLGGCAVMLVVNLLGGDVATIGSQFHYQLADGTQGNGIPQLLPQLVLPWDMPGSNFTLSWASLQALLPAAFSMAMLGAIESLLCAVVLDGMTGTKHKANSELIGQGLGNIVAPFFGGITATAAIARSAANVRAGATSPVAAVIHALLVILALLILARGGGGGGGAQGVGGAARARVRPLAGGVGGRKNRVVLFFGTGRGRQEEGGNMAGKRGRDKVSRGIGLRAGSLVWMLVTTAAFIVVAHPPVAVADLLVAANTGTGQPEHCANEDA